MNAMSRRYFLRWLTATVGATTTAQLLSACGGSPAPDRPTIVPTKSIPPAAVPARPSPTIVSPPTNAPTAQSTNTPTLEPTATTASAGVPDLVVARGGEPGALVQQALQALGGIERFVKPGNDVIIKPNICVAYHTYEYAATTNPWVVGELVKLCLGAGASRVRVMDFPFGGSAEEAYAISGIKDQVEQAGGSMETMSRVKFVRTQLTDAQVLKNCSIYDDAMKTDVLIDVPIAKHHSLARLTLGMKNLMGLIQNRESIHYQMGENLTDLTRQLHPTLTVVDAVRILMNNGPTGGDLNDVKRLDTLIASADIVAADSYAATLFGLQPDTISYIKAGAAAGLGRSDLKNLNIEELRVNG
jgi:uncharacterized protein (DUF362 family)